MSRLSPKIIRKMVRYLPRDENLLSTQVFESYHPYQCQNQPRDRRVDREVPKEVRTIRFNFKDDPDFGMLNLGYWKKEITSIEDPFRMVIEEDEIRIHFPLYDQFYSRVYCSQNGFTFCDLIDRIAETGIRAFNWDIKNNPERYYDKITGREVLGEYAITDTDIKIKEKTSSVPRQIYVSLQH